MVKDENNTIPKGTASPHTPKRIPVVLTVMVAARRKIITKQLDLWCTEYVQDRKKKAQGDQESEITVTLIPTIQTIMYAPKHSSQREIHIILHHNNVILTSGCTRDCFANT